MAASIREKVTTESPDRLSGQLSNANILLTVREEAHVEPLHSAPITGTPVGLRGVHGASGGSSDVNMGSGIDSAQLPTESQSSSAVSSIHTITKQADSGSRTPANMPPTPDQPALDAAMRDDPGRPGQLAGAGSAALVTQGSVRTLRRSSSGIVTILPAVESPREGDPSPDAGSGVSIDQNPSHAALTLCIPYPCVGCLQARRFFPQATLRTRQSAGAASPPAACPAWQPSMREFLPCLPMAQQHGLPSTRAAPSGARWGLRLAMQHVRTRKQPWMTCPHASASIIA